MYNKKAQGAIEYLLIIGAAILVVAVVIVAITSVLQGGKTNTNDDAIEDDQLKMIFATGGGTTQTSTIAGTAISIPIEKDLYYTKSKKVGKNMVSPHTEISQAYSKGAFIIKIENVDIRNLNFNYNPTCSENSTGAQSFCIYCTQYGGNLCKLVIRKQQPDQKSITIQYIDYNRAA
jgi:hypothetical protein